MTGWIKIITRDIESLRRRYNPENDFIPGAPSVTYADNELLQMVENLVRVVERQQAQIDELKEAIK